MIDEAREEDNWELYQALCDRRDERYGVVSREIHESIYYGKLSGEYAESMSVSERRGYLEWVEGEVKRMSERGGAR